jgi:hypothetical protein
VRPSGLEGAVVAGFFGVLEAPYPVTVVADTKAGMAALGAPEGLAPPTQWRESRRAAV